MGVLLERFYEVVKEGGAVLDLGCGSGRDGLALLDHGFDVTLLDGCEEMCRLAEAHTGLDALHMRFEEMDFDEAFDGIWASASLLHVKEEDMTDVYHRLIRSLVPGGVLYVSYRHGSFKGMRGERYFCDFTWTEFKKKLEEFPELEVIETWKSMDLRKEHAGEKWLNVLLRKKEEPEEE
ncbi:MAG: class I SAM-dependent methyltransferase [Lachnospiraceae bacterium]|nr:class I SAM-dependent methyltransferase [Lachnospiraceae bacterium]